MGMTTNNDRLSFDTHETTENDERTRFSFQTTSRIRDGREHNPTGDPRYC